MSDNKDPEQNEYDDDEYKYYPSYEYNEYGYPKEFKFDWTSWEMWLKEALNDIVQESPTTWNTGKTKEFPVNGSTSKGAYNESLFAYLGSNCYNEPVWKSEYFVKNELHQEYIKHIQSNAEHFLKQPLYYKGLFDNLN